MEACCPAFMCFFPPAFSNPECSRSSPSRRLPNPLLRDGTTGRVSTSSAASRAAAQGGKEKNGKSAEGLFWCRRILKVYITSRQTLFYKVEIPCWPANKHGAVTEAGHSVLSAFKSSILSLLVDKPLHTTAQKQWRRSDTNSLYLQNPSSPNAPVLTPASLLHTSCRIKEVSLCAWVSSNATSLFLILPAAPQLIK